MHLSASAFLQGAMYVQIPKPGWVHVSYEVLACEYQQLIALATEEASKVNTLHRMKEHHLCGLIQQIATQLLQNGVYAADLCPMYFFIGHQRWR
jgi:hypothetical protein